MSEANKTSIILKEHRNIVFTRYLLTLLGFVVILAGSLITLFLTQRRGGPDFFLIIVYVMIGINALQICLCALDLILRAFAGLYTRVLSVLTYLAGAGWLIALIADAVLFYLSEDFLRTDLMIITIVQVIVAMIVYIVIPVLERKSLNSFIKQDVRVSPDKRKRVSKAYIRAYAILIVCVILAQALTLLAYRVPPRVYDLFSDTRALEYELSEDGNAYIVAGVYDGTSTKVNVPAEYNDKPVIGIATGAITDDDIFAVNKIDSITFGTTEVLEDGTEVLVSELRYIESGAIVNNQITTLELPESIETIGTGAISGGALNTIRYSSQAEFSANCFDSDSIKTIILSGENVGRISSLEGLDTNVSIQVNKDIYNQYRKENPQFSQSFSPILDAGEFCIDFYTDCDYYIESIIAQSGTTISLGYEDLIGPNNTGRPISIDTLAYIKDNREVATDGAKDGYAFRGWFFDPEFIEECRFSETQQLTFTQSTSLYAKWAEEYTAELDWGTYTPDSAVDQLYWAEGESIELPKADFIRTGFDAGVKWLNGNEAISNTEGVSENISLVAEWQLDIPEVGINTAFTIENYDSGNRVVRFTYDEGQILTLKALASHTIPVNFLYRWECDDVLKDETSSIEVQNVPEQGTYTLTVIAVAPTGERSSQEDQLRVEINRKALDKGDSSISERYDLVYNGSRQSITMFAIPEDIAVNLVFSRDGSVVSEGVMTSPDTGVIDAGIYELTAEYRKRDVATAANYESVVESADFVVNPKSLTNFVWRGSWQSGDITDNTKVEYNGERHSIVMTYDGVIGDDQVFPRYEVTGDETNMYRNVGTYVTTLQGIDNANYSIANCTNLSHEWQVIPKTVSVQSWMLDGVEVNNVGDNMVVYDSSTHTVSANLSGVVPADMGSIELVYGGTFAATNVGSYEASVSGMNNANYQFDQEDDQSVFAWNIDQRALSSSFSVPEELIYNGNIQTVSLNITGFAGSDHEAFNISSFNDIIGTPSADISVSDDESGNFRIVFGIKDAGNYALSVGNDLTNVNEVYNNYTFEGASVNVTVEKRLLADPEITKGYVYDGTEQTLELVYSGFYNEDAKNVMFEGINGGPSADGKSYVLTTSGTNAGEYELAIAPEDIVSSNYSISAYNATFTIEKRVLELEDYGYDNVSSVTSFIYNGVAAEAYAVFSNFAHADIPEDYFRVTLPAGDGGEIKNAGEYNLPITIGLLNDRLGEAQANYAFAERNYVFTIDPKPISPSWSFTAAPDGSATNEFIYSGSAIAPPTASFGSQIVAGDAVNATYDDQSGKTASGTYTISIVDLNNDNYIVEESDRTYTWNIAPKQLSFTWDHTQTYIYNGNYQAPILTVAGICGSDEISLNVLGTGSVSDAIKASASMNEEIQLFANAGNYSLTITSVDSDNYSLPQDNLAVEYEIQKATLTLSGWNWSNLVGFAGDDVDSGFNNLTYRNSAYTLENAVSDSLGMSKDVTLVYRDNLRTDVGRYTAEIVGLSGNDADNFALPNEGLSLEWSILPKAVQLNWSETQFTFNAETLSVTATYDSGAVSDTDGRTYGDEALSISYINNSFRNSDTYTAVATLNGGSGNYTLMSDTTAHEWQIVPFELGAPGWTATRFIYNGTALYPEAQFSLYSGADNIIVSYGYHADAVNVGEKTISVTGITGVDAINYTLSEAAMAEYTYEISPATVEIAWSYTKDGIRTEFTADSENVYDGNNLLVSAEVNNIMSASDTFSFIYEGETTVTNAGDYTVSLTALGNANYTLVGAENTSINFTILKRALDFTWSNTGDQVYSASGYTLIATPVNLVTEDTIASITYSGETTFTAVGEYTVNVVGVTFVDPDDANNYNWENALGRSATINITPLPVTIEWSDLEVIYDGAAHMPTVTITGADNIVIGSNEYSIEGPVAINAGSYEFEVVLNNNSNYTLTGATGDVQCTLTIEKLPVAAVWWNDSSSTSFEAELENGTYAVGAIVEGLAPGTYNVFYRNVGEQEFTLLQDGTLEEAGTYELRIELNDDYTENYVLSNALVTLELTDPEGGNVDESVGGM